VAMRSVDTSEIRRRYAKMTSEQFALLKREELTPEGQAAYDVEVQRRSTREWRAAEAQKEEEFARRRAGEIEHEMDVSARAGQWRWTFFALLASGALILQIFIGTDRSSGPEEWVARFLSYAMQGLGLYGLATLLGWLVAGLTRSRSDVEVKPAVLSEPRKAEI
jgi:hypothetical protein